MIAKEPSTFVAGPDKERGLSVRSADFWGEGWQSPRLTCQQRREIASVVPRIRDALAMTLSLFYSVIANGHEERSFIRETSAKQQIKSQKAVRE